LHGVVACGTVSARSSTTSSIGAQVWVVVLLTDAETPLEVAPVLNLVIELGQADNSFALIVGNLTRNGRLWRSEIARQRCTRGIKLGFNGELDGLAHGAVVLNLEREQALARNLHLIWIVLM